VTSSYFRARSSASYKAHR